MKNKLTFDEYLPFHLQICQNLSDKWNVPFYLKKTTWIKFGQKEEPFYEIKPTENTFSTKDGILELVCPINEIENKIKSGELSLYIESDQSTVNRNMSFNFNMGNERAERQYKDNVLKNGTVEQIIYFLSYGLVFNQGLMISKVIFGKGIELEIEDLIKSVKHHANFDQIIKEYLINQNIKKCIQSVQIKIKELIEKRMSALWIDDVFEIIFLKKNKEEILTYWKNELDGLKDDFNIDIYAPYLKNHPDGLIIVKEMLEDKQINLKNEKTQLLIRDAILESFPKNLETFSFLDSLKEINNDIFIDADINKVITIQFSFNDLQKKFKFKDVPLKKYEQLMSVLDDVLIKQKLGGIIDINIENLDDSDDLSNVSKVNMYFFLEDNHILTKKHIVQLLTNYYAFFIGRLDLREIINNTSEDVTHFLFEKGIEKWVTDYYFSLQLEDKLESKTSSIKNKI